MRISGPIAHDIVLELGPMDVPMDFLRACTDKLLTRWGLDAAANRALKRRAVPRGNPGAWASPNDYPTKMLFEHKSAAIHFALTVDAAGKPKTCAVQDPYANDFSSLTCNLMMQRARFDPALDANGQPVASYFVSTVRWQIFS